MSATVQDLVQYLLSGDLLGFLQAIYILAFGGNPELFYGVISLLGMVPIYIRTNSLILVSIIWILVGSSFLVAMPMVSGLATLLVILGIGGTLFSLYRGTKASYG